MNIQKELQPPSEWLTYINETAANNRGGTFEAMDNTGTPVILEWKKTDIISPDIAVFKQNICEIACRDLADIEVQFLQTNPQAVSEELFLKPCAPFFDKGFESVNWEAVKEKIQSTVRQFYLTDLSSFGPEVIKKLLDDVFIFVSIKDKETEKLHGFIMLSATPALPYGDIKMINMVLIPEGQNRGLDQLLLSTIFKIIPQTKRIFLMTRPTNDKTLRSYSKIGFTQDLNPFQDPNHKVNMEYLVLLEYKAERSNNLQNIADNLEIKK